MKSIILFLALAFAACNSNSKKQSSEVFTVKGQATHGYDVTTFYNGQPQKGDNQFRYEWNNAEWLFVNQPNLDKFKADPAQYAPQYGGYCAYGTAEGHKAPTELNTWTVRDGKLYFNYNKEVQQLWNKDQPGYIQKADSLWPSVKDDEF